MNRVWRLMKRAGIKALVGYRISVMVPYETLATEMTADFAKRSKLTGFKAIFGKVANFLAAFIPGQFILVYGKESATPFFYTALTYGVILCVAMGILW